MVGITRWILDRRMEGMVEEVATVVVVADTEVVDIVEVEADTAGIPEGITVHG